MKFAATVLTLYPEMFPGTLGTSLAGRALGSAWTLDTRNIRDFATDRHRSVDDTPAGGGAGMGIALAYRSCDHLVFNLAPGVRTEIIALIDVRYPPTERMPASSYNVFVERSR